MHVTFLSLLRNPVHFIAFGFGAGLAPKAPGTWGTLVALPIFFSMQYLSIYIYLIAVLVMAIVGVWICGRTSDDLAIHDPGCIVWDEIIGMLITMIALPANWLIIVLGFGLFRFFDILKPWPIAWLDKKISGVLPAPYFLAIP